jgi:hypothetical protein
VRCPPQSQVHAALPNVRSLTSLLAWKCQERVTQVRDHTLKGRREFRRGVLQLKSEDRSLRRKAGSLPNELYGAEHCSRGHQSFYATRSIITEFTRALHLTLSSARPIQSTPPHPNSPRSILILFTTYVLVSLSASFPLAFPPVTYVFLFSPIRVTCPAHLILLDLIIQGRIFFYKKINSNSECHCNK